MGEGGISCELVNSTLSAQLQPTIQNQITCEIQKLELKHELPIHVGLPTAEVIEASMLLPTHVGLPSADVVKASTLLSTHVGWPTAEVVEAPVLLPTHVGLATAEVIITIIKEEFCQTN